MIKLHRLNGSEVVINAELIETVESVPDTLINLTTGNKYLVREAVETVVEAVTEYRNKVLRETAEK